MAGKSNRSRPLHDNLVNARKAATPKVQRVTIVSGGKMYRPGKPPVQVCQAPAPSTVGGAVRRTLANPMMRKI